MDFYSVIMDFFWVSVILFVAKIIREHVKILQNFFIPVSLIAGFIAWVVGPYGLKIVPLTSLCGDYAGALITVLFATIGLQGLGIKKGEGKKRAKDIAGYCVYRQINWAVQFSVPMILSILLLSRLHTGGDLHPAFGWLIPVSFLGGTGPAIAAGQVLDKYGFSDFTGLGITAAAYGMLLGLIGGIIMTKLATKRGYTSYIENTDTISRELLTGIIPKGKRGSIGEETIASITLEPLAWHLALIMIPTGLAHIITIYGSKALGIELPEFSIAFFVSLILYYVFQATKVNDSVDPKVINGFGNLISDYVVVFSLAMVQVDVIIKYAAPFLLLMLAFTVWMVVWFWFCGPHLIGKDWFERGLFNWGYATGTFATGFCLLRVVDPNNRSTAPSDTAILTPFEHVVEITALSLGPVLLSTGAEWSYLGVVVVYGLLWVASIFFLKVWKRKVCKVSPTNPMYCPSEAQKDSQHSSCV